MYTVNFKDVGRGNQNWQAETEQYPDRQWMYKQVKSKKALMSECIEFDHGYNGNIYAGFRAVGTFEILEK